MPKWLIVLGIVLLGALLVAGCGDESGGEDTGPSDIDPPDIEVPAEPAPPEAPPQGGSDPIDRASCGEASRVEWADAVQHLGQEVAIFGPVQSVEEKAYFGDQGTALVVGNPEATQPPVDIFVPQRVDDRFAEDAGARYGERVVCAAGVLQEAEGRLVLVINEPRDIVLI